MKKIFFDPFLAYFCSCKINGGFHTLVISKNFAITSINYQIPSFFNLYYVNYTIIYFRLGLSSFLNEVFNDDSCNQENDIETETDNDYDGGNSFLIYCYKIIKSILL